jgi:Glycosyltransferases, probably involved in cell wall biogenesis
MFVLTNTQNAPLPEISIIIPCYNEERFIAGVLGRLVQQSCDARYEIVIVDGRSTDGTRQAIENFANENSDVSLCVVDNPARNIPTALNLGIRAARGELIVRMDAHSAPSINYVARCAELLRDQRAAIVGMPWHIKPGAGSLMARAIAVAVSHPLGAGDAKYRFSGSASQFVDTVPFGAFHKSLWEGLGGFNEALLANEDYDFNYRTRKNGGKILLDNEAHSDYFARASLSELAKQYFRYGLWKARMVKLHPESIKLRQLIPPLFVISLPVLAGLSLVFPVLGWLLLALVSFYLVVILAGSLQSASHAQDLKLALFLPAIFVVIHFCWGTGFVAGLSKSAKTTKGEAN